MMVLACSLQPQVACGGNAFGRQRVGPRVSTFGQRGEAGQVVAPSAGMRVGHWFGKSPMDKVELGAALGVGAG